MIRTRYILLLIILSLPGLAECSELPDTLSSDRNIIVKLMDFFDRSSHDETFEKSVDWGVLGGVGYSQERGFGVSANLTGGYRLDKSDSLSLPSWFAVMANVALNEYYSIESTGKMFLNSERHRIDHFFEYSSGCRDIWGVGYDAALYNAPIYYRLNRFIANVEYRYNFAGDFIIGSLVNCQYYKGMNITDRSYINNETPKSYAVGGGLLVEYDSRDNRYSATSGFYASIKGALYPQAMSSLSKSIYKGYVNLSSYHSVWRGGVIAAGLQGEFSTSGTPWSMLSSLGDYGFMRGYYLGRFVDNNAVSMQVELRQDIWWRLSGAVWGGCGNMYSSTRYFDISETLPSYGFGLRFNASNSTIVRLDLGFGSDTIGFLMRYNQAF
ncbi:MAG: hypothetical protein SNJ33_07735 [Rikenellaceae bacterium]